MPTKVYNSSSSVTSRISLDSGAEGKELPTCLILTFHVKSCNAYEKRAIAQVNDIRYSSQEMVLKDKRMQEWWEKNFTNCELGDLRLNQRARVIGRTLSLGLGKALSEVFSGANALKRAYKFLAM